MKRIGIVIVAVAMTSACKSSSSKGDVDACIQRGIQYYKDIGSYPTLSNGENADKKVSERCNRTATAF
jgi:hypothetical protein